MTRIALRPVITVLSMFAVGGRDLGARHDLATSSRNQRNGSVHAMDASSCRAPSRRIGSEAEPTHLPAETITSHGVFQTRNPQSTVRIRQGLDRQDPAKSRRFLRLHRSASGKPPHSRTEWRWSQSGANSSLASLIYRESTGKSLGAGPTWRFQPRDSEASAAVATNSL
jgi:hypothetical protein